MEWTDTERRERRNSLDNKFKPIDLPLRTGRERKRKDGCKVRAVLPSDCGSDKGGVVRRGVISGRGVMPGEGDWHRVLDFP